MAIITGTVGSDILNGTAAADVITGLESNDVMNGKAGDDDFIVKGGHGADYINGGADYDQLIVSSDFFTTYASVVLGYIDYVEGFHLDELSQDLKILASGTSMVKLNSFTTLRQPARRISVCLETPQTTA